MADTHLTRAQQFLKVQGILLIVFGAIGSILSALFILWYALSVGNWGASYGYGTSDWLAVAFIFAAASVAWLAPHVYFIISGIHLLKSPTPKIARNLSIINIVLGAMWNIVILAFAIVSTVLSAEYEHEYTKKK